MVNSQLIIEKIGNAGIIMMGDCEEKTKARHAMSGLSASMLIRLLPG